MWKVSVSILFSIFAISKAFNIHKFVNLCEVKDLILETNFSAIRLDKAYVCSDIFLSENDQYEIQNSNFDLSMEKIIVLNRGSLGYVNRNFFNLFPLAREIYFFNVSMKVNCPNEVIYSHVHPVKSIWIESCDIKGNAQANLFNYLRSLEKIRLANVTMDHKTLDEYFFRYFDIKAKIKEVEIVGCNFENIEEDAFDYMPELKTLEISNKKIDIPKNIFSSNKNLVNININGKKYYNNIVLK